jgi:hypothetical protein
MEAKEEQVGAQGLAPPPPEVVSRKDMGSVSGSPSYSPSFPFFVSVFERKWFCREGRKSSKMLVIRIQARK